MAKQWIINGVPAESIWRNKEVNGSYTVRFRKEDATLADIEGIDWAHPVVKRGRGNDERFHCLPEGYGFKLDSVNYVGSMQQYTAEISVLKQYLGDVTGYQAQIEELEEKAKEYQAQIKEQGIKISGLEEDYATAQAAASALEDAMRGKESEIDGLRGDLDTAKTAASALEADLEQAYELLYGGEDA